MIECDSNNTELNNSTIKCENHKKDFNFESEILAKYKKDLAEYLFLIDPYDTKCYENNIHDEYSSEANLIYDKIKSCTHCQFQDKQLSKLIISAIIKYVFESYFSNMKLRKKYLKSISSFIFIQLHNYLQD